MTDDEPSAGNQPPKRGRWDKDLDDLERLLVAAVTPARLDRIERLVARLSTASPQAKATRERLELVLGELQANPPTDPLIKERVQAGLDHAADHHGADERLAIVVHAYRPEDIETNRGGRLTANQRWRLASDEAWAALGLVVMAPFALFLVGMALRGRAGSLTMWAVAPGATLLALGCGWFTYAYLKDALGGRLVMVEGRPHKSTSGATALLVDVGNIRTRRFFDFGDLRLEARTAPDFIVWEHMPANQCMRAYYAPRSHLLLSIEPWPPPTFDEARVRQVVTDMEKIAAGSRRGAAIIVGAFVVASAISVAFYLAS